MKFAYVDESGDASQSDVFVMGGLVIDHHRLRKKTAQFDQILRALFERHPGAPRELKTRAFMRGSGGWSSIPRRERNHFLHSVCELAVDKGDKIYAIAISLEKFSARKADFPFKAGYWVASGLYVASLIQKKMQGVQGRKGITALVFDDNKAEMPKLSDKLYTPHEWFDGLYQIQKKNRGKLVWVDRSAEDRFDHIVNTGFAIKSEHSSLVQVADAFCWAYRRNLELETEDEEFEGERNYYAQLRSILDGSRMTLGTCRPCDAKEWYSTVRYDDWKL